MKSPYFADYDHCIVNLSNSILAYFGIQPLHKTLQTVDYALGWCPQNVVLLVLDGLGMHTLERQLPENSFLRTNLREAYSSVFPPTTVAATTSLLSGKYPIEHGWLGWDMFFPEVGQNVSLFPNTFSGTMTLASKDSMAWRRFPYHSILAQIQEAGFHSYFSVGHEPPYPKGLRRVLERTTTLCRLPHRKFIYAYYEHPDGMQHWKGCYSRECGDELARIDHHVREFCEQAIDSLILITADHGHIDIKGQNLALHPEITECLLCATSMEARACSFFVKPELIETFESRFHQAYGNEFLLLPMEQAFERGFFGPGKKHPGLTGTLGNYLAVSVGDYALFPSQDGCNSFVGHHSGMTRYEIEIPLVMYPW